MHGSFRGSKDISAGASDTYGVLEVLPSGCSLIEVGTRRADLEGTLVDSDGTAPVDMPVVVIYR